MKRVLHIVNTGVFSGLENVVTTICMNDLENKHTYVSPPGIINDVLLEYGVSKIDVEKVNLLNLKQVIRNNECDIIQAHDFNALFMVILNIITIKRRKIKVLSHIHNNHPEMRKFSIRSIIFLLCSFFVDKIIIVSESIKTEYYFRIFTEKKFVLLKNVINEKIIYDKASSAEISKEYDLCFIGRLTEQKDPLSFLMMIKELKDRNIKAVMIGDGELRQECSKFIVENKLEKNVDMIGFSMNPYAYLINSKMLVLPSKWEGFGLVALESLCLGKPAIVSNVGGLSTIVDKEVGKLCDSFDDFIVAIQKLLESSQIVLDEYHNRCKLKFNKLNNTKLYFRLLRSLYSCL